MARPFLIAVIGKSTKDPADQPSPEALRAAELVGANIAGAGAILITGGLSGVMEAASRGAKRANGLVIGMLPGFDKDDANKWVDVALTTGAVWTVTRFGRTLVRIDPARDRIVRRIPLGGTPVAVTAGGGLVAVALR